MRKVLFVTFLAATLGFSTLANASLQNNGNGLIYDTDLNITWYDAPAVVRNWSDSVSWATNLSMTANGKTYADWRLPVTVGGGGYDKVDSEMGHLYYTELGNIANDTSLDKGPFTNQMLANGNWSGNYAWAFNLGTGYQVSKVDTKMYYALAVHEGNVGAPAPVPIPPTIYLLGAGLFGVGFARKRFRK